MNQLEYRIVKHTYGNGRETFEIQIRVKNFILSLLGTNPWRESGVRSSNLEKAIGYMERKKEEYAQELIVKSESVYCEKRGRH